MNKEKLNIKVVCPYCGGYMEHQMEAEKTGVISIHNDNYINKRDDGVSYCGLNQHGNVSYIYGLSVKYMKCKECGHMALFEC